MDKTVIVQTWPSLEETREFLRIAGATDFVAGVVGWVDLTDPDLAATLSELNQSEHGAYLVGVRHQVHDEEEPNWLLRDDVQRGLESVTQAGLVYDLLTRPRELPSALSTVRCFPKCRFVIDHISKPDIKNGEIENGRLLMQPFSAEPHVYCKVSGMVTEADWQNWATADLRPYVDAVLEIFGSERLLFGSDRPVSLLVAPYAYVKATLEENIGHLDQQSRDAILGTNAINWYELIV